MKRCASTAGVRPFAPLGVAAVLLWVAAFAAFGLTGRTFGTHPDLFLFFAWINAAEHGQVPNVDFRSPLGALVYYLAHLGYWLAGGFAGALEAASLIVLALLLPCAVVILGRRLPLALALVILLAAAALVVVPWNPGNGPLAVSQGGFYNRWCWSALTLLLLLAGGPFASDATTRTIAERLEGCIVGALLLFLFFTKASYFLVGLVFVIGFGILLDMFRRPALLGLGILASTVAIVQVATGTIDEYLRELAATVQVSGPVWDGRNLPLSRILQMSLPYHGALAIACCIWASAAEARSRGHWRLWCFVLFASLATIAIQSQNGSEVCAFTLLAPLTLMALRSAGWRRGALVLLLTLFAGAQLARQAAATFAHATTLPIYTAVELPRMEGVFYLREEYVETLDSGVSLLARHDVRQGLLAFDRETYFAVLLNIAPVRGRLWCLHPGRTIDRASAPPADQMFEGVDYVLIRKDREDGDLEYLLRLTRDFMLDVYSDYLRRTYTMLDDNADWELWQRDAPGKNNRLADARKP